MLKWKKKDTSMYLSCIEYWYSIIISITQRHVPCKLWAHSHKKQDRWFWFSILSLSKSLTNHVLSMNSKFSFSVLHQYSTILFLRKRFHFSSSEWSKNFQMYDIIPILGLGYWYMNIECFYNDCVFIYRTFAIKCEHSYKILYCLQRTLVTKTWTSASFFNRLYLWHFKNNLFTLQHIKIVD